MYICIDVKTMFLIFQHGPCVVAQALNLRKEGGITFQSALPVAWTPSRTGSPISLAIRF